VKNRFSKEDFLLHPCYVASILHTFGRQGGKVGPPGRTSKRSAFRGSDRFTAAVSIRQRHVGTPLILRSGGKFVVSGVAEAYDARAKGRNRKFQMKSVFCDAFS
jgi:hypothetical protein